MNARTTEARRAFLTLGALSATLLTGVLPRVAAAQRAAGSLGVSLTVLPPVMPQPVPVARLRIDPDGMATLRATVPASAGASRLVVIRISSSADGFVATHALPDVVRRSSTTHIAREVDYRFEAGRSADGDAPQDVQLRLEYLVVAGT